VADHEGGSEWSPEDDRLPDDLNKELVKLLRKMGETPKLFETYVPPPKWEGQAWQSLPLVSEMVAETLNARLPGDQLVVVSDVVKVAITVYLDTLDQLREAFKRRALAETSEPPNEHLRNALQLLHNFVTYELSSADALRHEKTLTALRDRIVNALKPLEGLGVIPLVMGP
jgi:hypothetical protein